MLTTKIPSFKAIKYVFKKNYEEHRNCLFLLMKTRKNLFKHAYTHTHMSSYMPTLIMMMIKLYIICLLCMFVMLLLYICVIFIKKFFCLKANQHTREWVRWKRKFDDLERGISHFSSLMGVHADMHFCFL